MATDNKLNDVNFDDIHIKQVKIERAQILEIMHYSEIEKTD